MMLMLFQGLLLSMPLLRAAERYAMLRLICLRLMPPPLMPSLIRCHAPFSHYIFATLLRFIATLMPLRHRER